MNQPNTNAPHTAPHTAPNVDSRSPSALLVRALRQPGTIEKPHQKESELLDDRLDERQEDGGGDAASHRVILYNDDWHAMDVVMLQVQKATGCDILEAEAITLEAHFKGRAVCFRGARSRCHRVAGVLREIRLQAEVDCD